MNLNRYLILISALLLSSCEKDITLDIPQPDEKLVIEGYIENGQIPYLLLTKNTSFFSDKNFSNLDDLFIHDAEVNVIVDGQTVNLPEICIEDVPPALRPFVFDLFGIDPETEINICIYVALDTINFVPTLTGMTGKTYTLEIQKDTHFLTAKTYIPSVRKPVALLPRESPEYPDSLYNIFLQYDEPDTLGNRYRLYTSTNGEPFYTGYFASVVDDAFVNGGIITFELDRGYPPGTAVDFETFNLFEKNDTVIVKVCAIDQGVYDFWLTLETQQASGGPFASPIYIQSNMSNGLGIWGGYGCVFDTVIVK